MNVLPALLGACVYSSVGCRKSQSITIPIAVPGGIQKVYFDQRKNHNSSTSGTVLQPKSLKEQSRLGIAIQSRKVTRVRELNVDIQQERRVRQQHLYRMIEITERQHFNKLRVWGLLLQRTRYNIDYKSTISTSNYQPAMPDYVNINNVSGTSQLLRSTRYQVWGREKDRHRNKKRGQK